MENLQELLEELRSIVAEGIFRANAEEIETFHLLGTRIIQSGISPHIIKKSLSSPRYAILEAVEFAKKYPCKTEEVINKLDEGKNISWYKIKRDIKQSDFLS